jgi:single-strand DNA-binding protein
VLVAGRLRTNVWSKEGVTYERLTLEATTVGHDLTRGTATFFRAQSEGSTEDRDESLGELVNRVEAQSGGDGLQDEEVESLGEPSVEDPEERIDEDGVVSRVA